MAGRTRFGKDYYAILGSHPEATEEEIRRAYRRLALEWHPDRNPGNARAAEERFKEISEAYAVLIDPAKRREYDRWRQGGASGEFRHSREEIFRDLFADPRASAVFEELAREFERMGMHVSHRVFRETLIGGRTVVAGVILISPLTPLLGLFRLARAALRGAQGARPVEAPPSPQALPPPPGLLGRARRTGRWLLGLPAAGEAGAPARAAGDATMPLRITRSEAERGGKRRVVLRREDGLDEVVVTIPPGIRPGTQLRLRGKGGPGPGGLHGDLYLAIEVVDD